MATTGSMCLRSARQLLNISRQTTCLRQRYTRLISTETNSQANSGKESQNKTEENDPKDKLSEAEKKWAEDKAALENSLADMKDKYLRALSETENVRTRMIKQVDDARLYGIQGFCKDLLEVADILDKAVDSVPKDQLKSENAHLVNLYDGLTMTAAQLQKVFNKNGLAKIDTKIGDEFDPKIHEALFQVPTPIKEADSTIADIQKIGYQLKERTLRASAVGVFKAS